MIWFLVWLLPFFATGELAALWRYDSVGLTVIDGAGQGNDMTLIGNAEQFDGELVLPGGEGYGLVSSLLSFFDPMSGDSKDAITVFVRLQYKMDVSMGQAEVFNMGDAVMLRISSGHAPAAQFLAIDANDTYHYQIAEVYGQPLDDGNWHSLAARWQKGQKGELWVDGKLKALSNVPFDMVSEPTRVGKPGVTVVGRHANQSPLMQFTGQITDSRVYFSYEDPAELHLTAGLPAGVRPMEPPAFPGAEGWGAVHTVGGRGGQVMHVTTLADAGPGSLREALLAMSPRVVVFDVSGTIVLESQIWVRFGQLTVAGQTAPGDGITISSNGFDNKLIDLEDSVDNVVFRYLRFRPTSNADVSTSNQGTLFMSPDSSNIILDHCDFSYSRYVLLNAWATNFTIQYSTFHDALSSSSYSGGPRALSIRYWANSYTVHKNLFVRSISFNPYLGGDNDFPVSCINNMIDGVTNAISVGADIGNGHINMIGNVARQYPNNNRCGAAVGSSTDDVVDVDIFAYDNIDSHCRKNNSMPEDIFFHGFLNRKTFYNISQYPFPSPPLKYIVSTSDLLDHLVTHVGCTRPKTDSIRDQVVQWVRDDAVPYFLPNDHLVTMSDLPTLTSLSARTDTDQDGMPDDFEQAMGFDPDTDDSASPFFDGYTRLDAWLNSEQLVGSDWYALWPMPGPPTPPSPSPSLSSSTTTTPPPTPPGGFVVPGGGGTGPTTDDQAGGGATTGAGPPTNPMAGGPNGPSSPTAAASDSLVVPLAAGGGGVLLLLCLVLFICLLARRRQRRRRQTQLGDPGSVLVSGPAGSPIAGAAAPGRSRSNSRGSGGGSRSRSGSRSRHRSKRASVSNYTSVNSDWSAGASSTEYARLPSNNAGNNMLMMTSAYTSMPTMAATAADNVDAYVPLPTGGNAGTSAGGTVDLLSSPDTYSAVPFQTVDSDRMMYAAGSNYENVPGSQSANEYSPFVRPQYQ